MMPAQVLTRHENIGLRVVMASHFSGDSLASYDMYNTYNSMRSVHDVLYGVKKLRPGKRGELHGVGKRPKMMDHVWCRCHS